MNKKTKINLLPLLIFLGIAIVVYFLFLNDKDLFNPNREPEVRRLNGFPTTVYTEKDVEKERVIIRSEQELAEFLNRIDESGYLIVREKVDFEKEILLGVSSSTNDEEGHEIKVRKLYEDKENNKLLVSVRELELGDTCEKIMNKNITVDVVVVSKTDMEIDFERFKQVEECE